MPRGLARPEREGLLQHAEGDLLDLATVRLAPGAAEPSQLVVEGRTE